MMDGFYLALMPDIVFIKNIINATKANITAAGLAKAFISFLTA